ncbi:hypothetical protein AB9E13_33995, partial [Rhizobium leguminosarum]
GADANSKRHQSHRAEFGAGHLCHPVYRQQHRDRQVLHNINVTVRKGEVVGIAGLMGEGRTEFDMSLFGKAYGHKVSGEALMHGKPVDV